MNEYAGKRLLVLGGVPYHLKVVRAAQEMGIYTIVTDYLPVEDSPCKEIADKSYQIDLLDIDGLVEMCQKEHIDGVLGAWCDTALEAYYEVCHQLGLPCYINNREQLTCLTDKVTFKECCKKYGVDTIPGYEVEDLLAENAATQVQFPVIVKPARNRGSRGCTVCHTLEAARKAISEAQKASQNGCVIVEQHMQNVDMLSILFFVVNGEPYLLRATDCYCGPVEKGIDRLIVSLNMPSKHIYTSVFQRFCCQMKEMIRGLGIDNGPVFCQGFTDGISVRLFDPGFRFAGSNQQLAIKYIMGIDMMKSMIEFALTGCFSGNYGKIDERSAFLNGYVSCSIKPTICAGRIAKIQGIDKIITLPGVIDYTASHKVGDTVENSGAANQQVGEVVIVSNSPVQCRETAKKVMELYQVLDDKGEDMIVSRIDGDDWEWGQNEKVGQ